MAIEISTPALLFPAISLLLLAYTNRFMGLAQLIRELHGRMGGSQDGTIKRQIDNLRRRVKLIIQMQTLGVLSITACVLAMVSLYLGANQLGHFSFGLSLLLMTGSLVLSLMEILISGKALKIELEDMQNK